MKMKLHSHTILSPRFFASQSEHRGFLLVEDRPRLLDRRSPRQRSEASGSLAAAASEAQSRVGVGDARRARRRRSRRRRRHRYLLLLLNRLVDDDDSDDDRRRCLLHGGVFQLSRLGDSGAILLFLQRRFAVRRSPPYSGDAPTTSAGAFEARNRQTARASASAIRAAASSSPLPLLHDFSSAELFGFVFLSAAAASQRRRLRFLLNASVDDDDLLGFGDASGSVCRRSSSSPFLASIGDAAGSHVAADRAGASTSMDAQLSAPVAAQPHGRRRFSFQRRLLLFRLVRLATRCPGGVGRWRRRRRRSDGRVGGGFLRAVVLAASGLG